MVLSHLHKAIKPLNQLRMLEDAVVIYRISRAPERRIFYIDVGNLPKVKAEQYLRDMMVRHKNRLVYDAGTGEVRDDRKYMTMLEDYWLPRREGGRGTEVTTLPGGQTLGEMDDVLYFQKKLYQTLNVPVNRLNSDALFSLGRATEVTRDEVKFSRFITRIRSRFSTLFTHVLEKQLVLKQIMSIEDWEQIESKIKYKFAKDNYFTELKDAEVLQNRTQLMMTMEQSGLIGKYYSHEWARRNILQQSDDDIEEQDKEINIEMESGDPRWMSQEQQQQAMMDQQNQQSMMDDQQQQQQQPDNNADEPNNDPAAAKQEQLRQAEITVKQMKQKGAANRSIQDESKYKSAVQILARNK